MRPHSWGEFMISFVRVCSKKDFVNNRYLAVVDDKPIAIFQIDS
jgi:hypothetical protein